MLEKIKDGTFALLTDTEISKKLRLNKQEAYAVRDKLHALCREGELLRDSRYRFGTAEQFGATVGTISGNERGFAFFMPDGGGEDLFIPRRFVNGALHGDKVLAIRRSNRIEDDEGEILAVISRGYGEIVGTFYPDHKGGYLHPDEKKFCADIYIPAGKTKNCKNGAKAVAKITSYEGKTPRGEISEILGESGDFFVEELALIRSHKLHEEFPAAVLREAEFQSSRRPEDDLAGRVDLRGELIITVDGEDTRDIDDAISIRKENGKYLLGVHIADVTHYVSRGSALDREAFSRGTSVYFPDRVLPMLPPALSNGICSLNEGVDRLSLSCFMTVNAQGNVLEKRVAPSIIRSAHRMTYTQITEIYENNRETRKQFPDLIDFVNTAIELTEILKKARTNRGGVTMDIKEAKILYRDGKISIPDYDRSISHEMIEQFMVLANESVATLTTERKLPFVYRIHERPSPDKARDFAEFLNEAGINAKFDPESVSPADYRDLLKSIETSSLYPIVNRVMLRSMMKAVYSPENAGHFGLASDCYCHFTSPIRRYPDLCIHRIIKESLKDAENANTKYRSVVPEVSTQSSACERNAAEAEREVDALYTVAYMQDKIGETYEAVISGVTSFGLFAELKNTIEGFIPIETLPEDGYEFIEERYLLRGTKNSYRLGAPIQVSVAGVDWGNRRVHFTLLNQAKEQIL